MEKKNTVLLTVIAIATLLVAVVGATFAYFSANTANNNARVEVVTETKAADILTTAGTPSASLTVNASDMQVANGKADHSVFVEKAANGQVTLSLTAGSGVATCTYNLYYVADEANVFENAAGNTANSMEYSIEGTSSKPDTLGAVDLAGKGYALVDGANKGTKLNETAYSISDDAANADATEITWNFTTKFYNLDVDQSTNAGQTFNGSVVIDDIVCTNSANQ